MLQSWVQDHFNFITNAWMASVGLYLLCLLFVSILAYFSVAWLERFFVRKNILPQGFRFVSRFFLSFEFLLIGLAMLAIPTLVKIPRESLPTYQGINRFVLVFASAWLVMKGIDAVTSLWLRRLKVDQPDNLRERRLRTQILYLEKVMDAVVIVVAIGFLLVGFEQFRRIGGSLLASAGLASLILGFAAQKSLGNLIAGLQIAFTQPIRLGDAVLVEGEWGEIDEITLTYVVVRLWDLRRMVVPINYFLEKPFQNWTRTSADLLGFVLISADYGIPVESVREEFTRLLRASSLWDGKVNVLQVVDANERAITLRALMSARNAGAMWDLRCEIREKLLAFIRDHFPHHLPKTRLEPGPQMETRQNLSAS